jgi:hypothetical protein
MAEGKSGKSAAELFNLDSGESALATKVDALEKELEAERDYRREDRFVALVVIMLLCDVILIGEKGTSITVVVLIFELVVLFVIAKRMGVEQIAGILDRILSYFAKKQAD